MLYIEEEQGKRMVEMVCVGCDVWILVPEKFALQTKVCPECMRLLVKNGECEVKVLEKAKKPASYPQTGGLTN